MHFRGRDSIHTCWKWPIFANTAPGLLADAGAATTKAKDIVKVAVSRARWLYPQDEEQIPVTDAALVIGGGVAGMQAALDLADAGTSGISG